MNYIPKIIHYCWFGNNPIPPLALKCIESWKKYCPDYEIKEWNESNFDINFNIYTKEAYKNKKWAFVSDIARLYAVYTDGGVYLDTDVEIIKPIDKFLDNRMFIGFENNKRMNTGLGFGAEKNFHIVKKMLDIYNGVPFIKQDDKFNLTPCPVYNSAVLKQEGFTFDNRQQTIDNVTVYPTEYFCPKDSKTKMINITENTYAIHHFDGSWLTDIEKQEKCLISECRKKYGHMIGEAVYAFGAVLTFRKSGINNIIEKIKYKMSEKYE